MTKGKKKSYNLRYNLKIKKEKQTKRNKTKMYSLFKYSHRN